MKNKWKKYFWWFDYKAASSLILILAVAWFTLGVLRFFTYKEPVQTHYHANFKMYINEEIYNFEDMGFYEEVAQCSIKDDSPPESRAHMHDNVGSVVHVHDDNVTWGHFFENIDFSISDKHIQTWSDIYVEDGGRDVRFFMNGKEIVDPSNTYIKDQDRLLVAYGDESAEKLQERNVQMQNTALFYNTQSDPASCSAANPNVTLGSKLRYAFLFHTNK